MQNYKLDLYWKKIYQNYKFSSIDYEQIKLIILLQAKINPDIISLIFQK